jgi:hypothetical protein
MAPHYPDSSYLRNGLENWSALMERETLAGSAELEAHYVMESWVWNDVDLVVTRKGVVAVTDAGEAKPTQVVALLATADFFLLCDVCHEMGGVEAEPSEDQRAYRIRDMINSDHLNVAGGKSLEISLEQVWPGDYQVETLEIR